MQAYIEMINKIPDTNESGRQHDYPYTIDELEKIIKDVPIVKSIPKTDTIARIFGKTRDENFVSDWLAYLIRNDRQILGLIFEYFAFDMPIVDYEVIREYGFESGRRIDLLVDSDEFIIGIENKIDSGQQLNQLKDYNKSLSKLAGDRGVLMFFLKPSNNKAIATHGFLELTYDELSTILKKVNVSFVYNLRFAFLLQDFITHLEENLMSKNSEYSFNEWTLFLGEHQKKIKTIQDAGKTEVVNLVEYVQNELHSLVDYSDEWDFSKHTASLKYLQFFKKGWKQDLDVHYELYIRRGLFLPEEVVVRVDIEGKASKQDKSLIASYLGLQSNINVVGEAIEFDYTSEETLNASIENLKDVFLEVIEKYTGLIDEWFKRY